MRMCRMHYMGKQKRDVHNLRTCIRENAYHVTHGAHRSLVGTNIDTQKEMVISDKCKKKPPELYLLTYLRS
jgi:hypothetical protein